MHLLSIPGVAEPIPTYQGRPLEPHNDYICTNAFAGLILLSPWKVSIDNKMWGLRSLVKVTPLEDVPFDTDKDWNGKHIWLLRGGGWGDLLLLSPLINEIQRRWPEAIIHMACGQPYHELFKHTDVIPELLPIPADEQIDALISFEDLVEGNPAAEMFHMVHLFARKAGIEI